MPNIYLSQNSIVNIAHQIIGLIVLSLDIVRNEQTIPDIDSLCFRNESVEDGRDSEHSSEKSSQYIVPNESIIGAKVVEIR